MNEKVQPLILLVFTGGAHAFLVIRTKLNLHITQIREQNERVEVIGTNQGIGGTEEGPPGIEEEKFDCYCSVLWLLSIPYFPP